MSDLTDAESEGGIQCPMCGGIGRIFDVTAAIEDAQRAGEIRLVEPAALHAAIEAEASSSDELRAAASNVLAFADTAIADDGEVYWDVLEPAFTELLDVLRAALSGSSDPEAQCSGYAGDPGASAPRCESYAGHPGRHFIRPFGSSDPEAVRLDVGALRSVVEQAARMGSCSQTHHEWIAKAAVAALTEAKPSQRHSR